MDIVSWRRLCRKAQRLKEDEPITVIVNYDYGLSTSSFFDKPMIDIKDDELIISDETHDNVVRIPYTEELLLSDKTMCFVIKVPDVTVYIAFGEFMYTNE